MNRRHNFYKIIHKGIRSLLSSLIEHAGRTGFTDAVSLSVLKAEVHSGFELLESHAHNEEAFIGPVLERLLPELAERTRVDHISHGPEMAELLEVLSSIEPSSHDAAETGHRLVVSLSSLSGELMLHMADEEQLVMPALWTVLTDNELLAIERQLVASIPPEKMSRYLRWMIPTMNTAERIEMLGAMRAGAPAEVFEATRTLARTLLSPTDDEALSRGLAEAA